MTAEQILREGFLTAALRYHLLAQQAGKQEHRWWTFQHCPADCCVDARMRLLFAGYVAGGPLPQPSPEDKARLARISLYAALEGKPSPFQRRPAATGSQAPAKDTEQVALAEFTDYFVTNYPGPHTVICDPRWHAAKIFRAATRALFGAIAPERRAGG